MIILMIKFYNNVRHKMQQSLPEYLLPAFKAVESVYNITPERGWRPIQEKKLGTDEIIDDLL